MSVRIHLLLCLVILSAALAACTALPAISTDISYCCKPETGETTTYRIEFDGMPEFLKPMMRDEVSIVLDQKFLQYTESNAQAVLTMTFINTPMEQAGVADNDEAWGSLSAGGSARFNAEVRMEMKDAVTQELICAGAMSRLHNVGPGAYMHEAPARSAMREALITLFADYPSPIPDLM